MTNALPEFQIDATGERPMTAAERFGPYKSFRMVNGEKVPLYSEPVETTKRNNSLQIDSTIQRLFTLHQEWRRRKNGDTPNYAYLSYGVTMKDLTAECADLATQYSNLMKNKMAAE